MKKLDGKIGALGAIWFDFFSLFFPHTCALCETGLARGEEVLCLGCLSDLPRCALSSENDIAATFFGRLPLSGSFALYDFKKGNAVQRLLHLLKYKGYEDIGTFLGKQLGHAILESPPLSSADYLIPIPLHKKRLRRRGYNQSLLIAEGIRTIAHIPILSDALIKQAGGNSQTRKGNLARWEETASVFAVPNEASIQNKHIILIDDVVTTGATLERGGDCLLKAGCGKLSVVCAARAVS